jgi:hypothetical protein
MKRYAFMFILSTLLGLSFSCAQEEREESPYRDRVRERYDEKRR